MAADSSSATAAGMTDQLLSAFTAGALEQLKDTSDCTLKASDGTSFEVHKVMIARVSEFFRYALQVVLIASATQHTEED